MGKSVNLYRWLVCFGLIFPLTSGAGAAEQEKAPARQQVERSTNALAGFLVQEGFRIELVAGESLVASPAAMAFDENRRLFVAEMRDYPGGSGQGPPRGSGRIRVLEDKDGDGVFDTSTVYADNLAWPSAIACSSGGVFVGATPEVLFLKDTAGNGIADVRKVVFNAVGATKELRADTLLNNFTWGLDNRIHVGTAGLGGTINGVEISTPVSLELGRNDFAFDPRSLVPVAEAGSAQTGLCFDDFGRRFFCDLSRPLRTPMYDPRYTARNPFFVRAPDVFEAMNSTPIFRSVSNDPSRARLAAPSLAEPGFGPLTPAWLTFARGCVIYRGNIFPPKYLGNVFVADPEANVIHRAVLGSGGLTVTATRAPEEPASEFIISKDPSFHPSQIINGPEGGLYIADMREGGNHGRIYRIVPSDFRQTRFPSLGQAKAYDLAASLAQTNGWMRDTAARLLHERRDPAAIPLLTNVLNNSRVPTARLHALHTLDGLNGLNEALVLRGLRDPDEHVREHAVLLSERLLKEGVISETLWAQLKLLAGDPAARVRYQLAFTLGSIRRPDRVLLLSQIIRRDPTDRWVESAVLSSLSQGAGEFFVNLAGDGRFRNDTYGQEFLQRLLTMIGVQGRQEEVAQVVDFIDRNALVDRAAIELRHAYAFLFALGDGLHRNRSGLALVDQQGRLQRFFAQAQWTDIDDTLAAPVRIEAIRLLSVSTYTFGDIGDLLLLLFGTSQPFAVQSAALAALGRLDDARIATNIFSRMQFMTPTLRQEAVAAVLGKIGGAGAVLGGFEAGFVGLTDLSSTQLNFLRTHGDSAISQRATRLFGPFTPQRAGILEQFRPAVRMAGTASRGQPIFSARCAQCHRLGTEGRDAGPDLAPAKSRGKDRLLAAILAPNLEIAPDYGGYVMGTGNLETLIGMIPDQSPVTYTIAQAGRAPEVWPKATLQTILPQQWSLMPEGLEAGLSVQGMADLLEFIMTTPR
jgi:putative membrane-bound dehydrogenase-like protein